MAVAVGVPVSLRKRDTVSVVTANGGTSARAVTRSNARVAVSIRFTAVLSSLSLVVDFSFRRTRRVSNCFAVRRALFIAFRP